jgi:hypothetical protein
MGNRPHHPFIHILDDDSLLIVFNFCRPALKDEDENNYERILQGGNWARERWWYKLVQVCQRWRHLVLASASYLDLCLVCTRGTPVADMLAHSPPLPLIIDYLYPPIADDSDDANSLDDADPLDDYVTVKDEEGVALALQHRNRVRRIRIQMPTSNLLRLIMAIDGEFLMLDYLYFTRSSEYPTNLILPKTFQAPRLRHLILLNTAIPIGSPLLITCVSLVTLSLRDVHSLDRHFSHFPPNNLLQRLSSMLHLESLDILIHSLIPKWETNYGNNWQNTLIPDWLERQSLLTPITLPNLRWFRFGGPMAYLEALLLQITAPLLEKIQILALFPRTFRGPRLLQFMNAAENLRFGSATFRFCVRVVLVWVYPQTGARMYSFFMCLRIGDLFVGSGDQMVYTTRIVRELTTVFSVVEHLTLENGNHIETWGAPTQWRDFLGSFGSVKTLLVYPGLVGDISRSFQLDKGESPTQLLPELKKLSYFATGRDAGDAFTAFADARQRAGRPVTLSRL